MLELVRKIPRELIEEVYRKNCRGEYWCAANLVRANMEYVFRTEFHSSERENLLLAGFSRVGKSFLAEKLGCTLTLPVLSLDAYRNFFWKKRVYYSEIPDVIQCRDVFYRLLFEVSPSGVIIEGSDLILHLVKARLHSQLKFRCFVLGVEQEQVSRKAEMIRQSSLDGYCRGTKSREEAYEIASRIFRYADRVMQNVSCDTRYHFIDVLKKNGFSESMEFAARRVIEHVEKV